MTKPVLSTKHAEATINIIPMLDVLLVLVAVLLLLTPYIAESMNVSLPQATHSSPMTQDTSIVIELHEDGTVWHAGTQVQDWSSLYASMKGATTARIYADKGVAFAAVARLLDQLAEQDIHNIQFAVKA